MSDHISAATYLSKRKWVGVLLSLFVPGFGLVRAGRISRGVAWFFAIQITGVLAALLTIWRSIPFGGVLAGLVVALGCQLTMLVDSCRPGKLRGWLWLAFPMMLAVTIFVGLAPNLFAHAFTIPTDGMAPTLRGRSHGTPDHIIADRLSYMFSPPKRGELVVFRTTGLAQIPADAFFVQRLVGLPGEKIEIHDAHVYADGRQLGESDGIPDIPYTTGPTRPFMTGSGAYQIPPHSYFMLGDNSPNSFDSRYWGYLPKAHIYARVARIYYPFARASVPR